MKSRAWRPASPGRRSGTCATRTACPGATTSSTCLRSGSGAEERERRPPYREPLRRSRRWHAAERRVRRPGLHERAAHRRAPDRRRARGAGVRAQRGQVGDRVAAVAAHRAVHQLRRVGRLLRPRRRRASPTCAARRPIRPARTTSDSSASACRAWSCRRTRGRRARVADPGRLERRVRALLDPALHRVAVPARPLPHRARPLCEQHRSACSTSPSRRVSTRPGSSILLPRPLFQSCPCDGEVLEGTLVGDPIEAAAGDGFAQLAEVIEGLSGIPIGTPQLADVCGGLPTLP